MAKHTFKTPLVEAKFVKRYKRFFVEAITPSGETITAHTNNTGSMKGLLKEGATAYFTHHNDPARKLQYTFEMIDVEGFLVSVNTNTPNSLVYESIKDGNVPELAGYANAQREVKYGKEGKSRIDVLLTDEKKGTCYVEVKNTTLKEGTFAAFPDAVTERGTKHLEELILEVEKGNRAVMFYFAGRGDCTAFKPADDIDPVYGKTLRKAIKAGVEVICYACEVSPEGIRLLKPLSLQL